MPPEDEMFIITGDALEKIKKVMKRLYSEERLKGDEYRDLAHTLQAALNSTFEAPRGL